MNLEARRSAPPTDREIIDSQDDRLSIHTHRIHLTQDHLPYTDEPGKRLASEKHFAVYADQIVLDGTLRNPGRNIELYAREIVLAQPVTLDVAGAYADKDFLPGDLPIQKATLPGSPGTAGADASKGGAGGSIIVFARNIDNRVGGAQALSVTDIASIGAEVFSAQSVQLADTLDLPKFVIGKMKFYGNQSLVFYLEKGRVEGLSRLQYGSSHFDGTTGQVSLRFSIPDLVVTGLITNMGSQRQATKPFSYQVDVSATLGDDGKAGAVQLVSSLAMDAPIGFVVPMLGPGAVPAEILNKMLAEINQRLHKPLFEPLLYTFADRMQTATFSLLASGGRGGRGQDGHAGVTGEPGADGVKPKRPGMRTRGGYGFPEEAIGKNGKPGGRAGSAGHSGDGGTGGIVQLNVMEPIKAAVFYATAGGDGGAMASPGARGKGGTGGKGALCRMMDEKGKPLDDMHATNGSDGSVGAPASFNGNRGALGDDGQAMQLNGKAFADGAVAPLPYAELAPSLSLSQLLITQNATDLDFLNARSLEDREPVADSYAWLVRINQPFTASAGGIDVGKMSQQEQAVRSSMHNSAVVALMRQQQGLDYYGHSYNWTPVLNLKSLVSRTGEIISLGKVIEDQYNTYLNKDKTDKERLDAFKKAKQEIDRKLADILAEIKKLGPQIDSFRTEVEDYTQDLRRQRKVLLEGQLEFKDELVKYLQEQNALDFDMFLDILGTVIGAVGGVASGVGGIKTAFDAFKKADEFTKKLKNVVEIFKKAKATVDSITKAYDSIKEHIDAANPDAGKIIVDADDFDKMLDEYLGEFPAAGELRQAMDYYLQLSQARNMAAYNYSALVGQVLTLQVQHDQLYEGIQHINAEIASNQDNLLPVYTAYLKDAYEDVQRNLLRNIYQETRAYEYWALESRQLQTSNLNIATLSATHQQLIVDIDGFRENNESFSNFKQKLEITPDRFPNEFAALPESRSLTFNLDIRDDLGFLNMRYIIARSFKLSFPGLEAGANVMYMNLVHSGRAVMNNNSDLAVPDAVRVFSHRPRVRMYKIDFSDSDNSAGGNFGEGGQGYIGLSPFSNWRIDFDLKGNDWLDLTQIQAVELTFEGRFLGPGRRLG